MNTDFENNFSALIPMDPCIETYHEVYSFQDDLRPKRDPWSK